MLINPNRFEYLKTVTMRKFATPTSHVLGCFRENLDEVFIKEPAVGRLSFQFAERPGLG
jgi:hypothetical protein